MPDEELLPAGYRCEDCAEFLDCMLNDGAIGGYNVCHRPGTFRAARPKTRITVAGNSTGKTPPGELHDKFMGDAPDE